MKEKQIRQAIAILAELATTFILAWEQSDEENKELDKLDSSPTSWDTEYFVDIYKGTLHIQYHNGPSNGDNNYIKLIQILKRNEVGEYFDPDRFEDALPRIVPIQVLKDLLSKHL